MFSEQVLVCQQQPPLLLDVSATPWTCADDALPDVTKAYPKFSSVASTQSLCAHFQIIPVVGYPCAVPFLNVALEMCRRVVHQAPILVSQIARLAYCAVYCVACLNS